MKSSSVEAAVSSPSWSRRSTWSSIPCALASVNHFEDREAVEQWVGSKIKLRSVVKIYNSSLIWNMRRTWHRTTTVFLNSSSTQAICLLASCLAPALQHMCPKALTTCLSHTLTPADANVFEFCLLHKSAQYERQHAKYSDWLDWTITENYWFQIVINSRSVHFYNFLQFTCKIRQ